MHMEKYRREAVSGVTKHNARVWEARGFERENIDNERIGLDYNLAPDRGNAVEWVNARIDGLGLGRKPRKDAIRMCEWVVTLPQDVKEDESRRFFESAYRTFAGEYGEENVVGAWVHLDEPGARPHMHFDFVPVTEDGRLSAKAIMTRSHLRQMHPRVQEAAERDLGHPVSVLMPEQEREARAGRYVSLPEYKAATRAAEAARDEAERASGEAGRTIAKAREDAAGIIARAHEAAAADVERSRLARQVAEKAERDREASEKAQKASEAARDAAKDELADASAKAEATKGRLDAMAGMSWTDERGQARRGLAGLGLDLQAARAEVEAQDARAEDAEARAGDAEGRALLAEARAAAAEERAGRALARAGVTGQGLLDAFVLVAYGVANVVLDVWDEWRDYAKGLWRGWVDGDSPLVARAMGLTDGERAEANEAALVQACDERQGQDVWEELSEGGRGQRRGHTQVR